jgi:uncharacterized protein (TIGR03032 family)
VVKVAVPIHSEGRWSEEDAAWRDPEGVISGRRRVDPVDRELLSMTVHGEWWEVLEQLQACLVVSREYEHLLVAMSVASEGPRQSFMSIPHPSGLAFDAAAERLHVASTRNPNQLYVLAPASSVAGATGARDHAADQPLVPLSASFLPGRLYLHDLALIGGVLHGNAVGLNAIVRLAAPGECEVVWWPRTIERDGQPDLSRNYLQLNSIAAGRDLASSFFSASAEEPSNRRPGHRNFPVDGRGVIFSGATREAMARGLTRPHSTRLYRDELWVNNSGYGCLAAIRDGAPVTVARLPGWTRGLTFADGVAFVGSSRVIPRFAHYAPGLDPHRSICGVHAIDLDTGETRGSVTWPAGNQVFDIVVLPRTTTLGFPALAGRRQSQRALSSFFFSYHLPNLTGAP